MNAHALPNRIQSRITPAVAESVMGLEAGSIQAVAWLVLQAEADGVTIEDIATSLSVTVEQIQALKLATTGEEEGEESEQIWLKGIVAIRTSRHLNTQSISQGWDSLEAMALEKLNAQMQELKTNGDPDKMLAIAVAANKANRRMQGEGNGSRGGKGPMLGSGNHGGNDIDISLSGGNIGSIRLQLSPRIQSQLSDPGRVIDGVANNAAQGKRLTDSLQMLKLGETRSLVESDPPQKSTLDAAHKQFTFADLPDVTDE